jgi:hypothetical protein
MSLFARKPMEYYRVEFWCAAPGFPSVIHVVANESDEAGILAKAKRIEGGLRGKDAMIEHIWQVRDEEKLKLMEKFRMELAPRIVDEKEIPEHLEENSASLVREGDQICNQLLNGINLNGDAVEILRRLLFIHKTVGMNGDNKDYGIRLVEMEPADEDHE